MMRADISAVSFRRGEMFAKTERVGIRIILVQVWQQRHRANTRTVSKSDFRCAAAIPPRALRALSAAGYRRALARRFIRSDYGGRHLRAAGMTCGPALRQHHPVNCLGNGKMATLRSLVTLPEVCAARSTRSQRLLRSMHHRRRRPARHVFRFRSKEDDARDQPASLG